MAAGGAGPAAIPFASLVLLLLALGCEFIDATIGMGYGTTLTPLLLILGYPVSVIVPAAVLSQLFGNIAAAFFHHRAGNVDFLRDRRARNLGLLLGGLGLAMSVAAVVLATRLAPQLVRTAVAAIVLGLGVFLLLGSRFRLRFSWRNMAILGSVAAFNKAFSGGGYGPLVCGGQVINGSSVRAAVGTTALAEAIVCVSTVGAYLVLGNRIPLSVLAPLVAGSLLSAPASAIVLRRLPTDLVRKFMGLAVAALGLLALLKATNVV